MWVTSNSQTHRWRETLRPSVVNKFHRMLYPGAVGFTESGKDVPTRGLKTPVAVEDFVTRTCAVFRAANTLASFESDAMRE